MATTVMVVERAGGSGWFCSGCCDAKVVKVYRRRQVMLVMKTIMVVMVKDTLKGVLTRML